MRRVLWKRLLFGAIAAFVLYYAVREEAVSATALLVVLALVPSIIIHEVSHGLVAYWFGDDTAKRAGRLTLDPIPHVDPFGTLLLPGMLALAGAPVFGYAKPVPVNVGRLRRPRDHGLLVSLAGPAVNIVLAIACALVVAATASGSLVEMLRVEPLSPFFPADSLPAERIRAAGAVTQLFIYAGVANALLASFNLIPIPPLDGSAVIERFLPREWWAGWLTIRKYSMLILFALVFFVSGFLTRVFEPALRIWAWFL